MAGELGQAGLGDAFKSLARFLSPYLKEAW